MNRHMLPVVAVLAAACAGPADVTPAAEEEALRGRRYHVIELRSRGESSAGIGINDLGIVSGHVTDGDTMEATVWFFGFRLGLGTLGGPNSAILWPSKNVRGVFSGVAETADLDPHGERWSCSAFFPSVTGHVCRGFVWENGAMRPLPTFGGTHGFATGTNNLGLTVGWAENTVRDPTCNAPQIFQFRAALWGPGHDEIRELPPLPGDTASAATAVNDAGQVAGISGICANAVGQLSARAAVLWEDGAPVDIGNLGGIAWNTPMAINQRGDVVGFANRPDADPPTAFRPLPFLWTRDGGIEGLGVLPDDTRGQALGVNDRRQVVGVSCGASCRAFLWEDGVMRDLNSLVASGARGTLAVAGDINDLGVITGELVGKSGARAAFIAIPR